MNFSHKNNTLVPRNVFNRTLKLFPSAIKKNNAYICLMNKLRLTASFTREAKD